MSNPASYCNITLDEGVTDSKVAFILLLIVLQQIIPPVGGNAFKSNKIIPVRCN